MEEILDHIDKDKKEETATTAPSGKRSGKAGKKKAGKKESGKAGKKGTTVPTDGATEREGLKPGEKIVEKILCRLDKDKKEETVTTAPSGKKSGKKYSGKKESGKAGKKGTSLPRDAATKEKILDGKLHKLIGSGITTIEGMQVEPAGSGTPTMEAMQVKSAGLCLSIPRASGHGPSCSPSPRLSAWSIPLSFLALSARSLSLSFPAPLCAVPPVLLPH